jgi:hypothetical protein
LALPKAIERLAALAVANDGAGISRALDELIPGAHIVGTTTDMMDLV